MREILLNIATLLGAQVSALRGRYPALDIEVDGGVSPSTIDIAAKVSWPFTPTQYAWQDYIH